MLRCEEKIFTHGVENKTRSCTVKHTGELTTVLSEVFSHEQRFQKSTHTIGFAMSRGSPLYTIPIRSRSV